MTRILIGTLRSIENEFTQCCEALHGQTLQSFEHFVIHGLPKREAHDALFQRFMERHAEFDLFLKLDADMVLARPSVLAEIALRFQADPSMQLLTVGVHDFFSGRLINGLHTFRRDVKWPLRNGVVFTDTHTVPRENVRLDFDSLAPAALHCPNPSPFQSFHFGLHRGLKLRAAIAEKRSTYTRIHFENLESVWTQYRLTRDPRLGWASLGAELSLQGAFEPEHISYTNPHAERTFLHHYSDLHGPSLERRLLRLRLANRLRHPELSIAKLRAASRRLAHSVLSPTMRGCVRAALEFAKVSRTPHQTQP